MATCEDCRFYQNECESEFQQKLLGKTPTLEICEIFQEKSKKTTSVWHGKWIKNWCDNNMIGHEYAECSICGCSMLDTNQFWDCNFCPNCGANMHKKSGTIKVVVKRIKGVKDDQ